MFQVLTDFEKKKKMARKLMGMKEDEAPKAAPAKKEPLNSNYQAGKTLPLFFIVSCSSGLSVELASGERKCRIERVKFDAIVESQSL
jgi:hypothetical protein